MVSAPRETEGAPRRAADVVVRDVAGETFLVPVRGSLADMNDLFALNETGAFLWPLLDGAHRPADLAAAVALEFEVDEQAAARDVDVFLRRLREAELLDSGQMEA